MTKKTTAFFGGSFNPPHSGHFGVAQAALNSGKCSEVVWVPSWSQPHKQGRKCAPFTHRLAMVELLLDGVPGMSASDLENRLQLQPSYTSEVMKSFAAELPQDETPALLIGGDSLLALHTWHCAEELVSKYVILTYPRQGEKISREALLKNWKEEYAEKLLAGVIGGGFFEISSTGLRNSMVKSSKAGNINTGTKNIIDSRIEEYCKHHHLYEDEKGKNSL